MFVGQVGLLAEAVNTDLESQERYESSGKGSTGQRGWFKKLDLVPK